MNAEAIAKKIVGACIWDELTASVYRDKDNNLIAIRCSDISRLNAIIRDAEVDLRVEFFDKQRRVSTMIYSVESGRVAYIG